MFWTSFENDLQLYITTLGWIDSKIANGLIETVCRTLPWYTLQLTEDCILRKIILAQVMVWTCEILGCQHMIFLKKNKNLRFPSHKKECRFDSFKSVCCSSYRGVHLIESMLVTVKWLQNGRNQHQVSVLERCQSYGEYSYSKMTEKRQEPCTKCPSYREYSYSEMTTKQQEPTPGVCLREMSVL